MTEAKRLEPGARSFEAGGIKFIAHEILTVDGFQRLEEFRIEIEAGNTAGDLIKMIKRATEALQKNDVYHASVALYNAINVAERIDEGRPSIWMLQATLFIRPEGSDFEKWNESEATEWIRIWEQEGIAVNDLFTLAGNLQTAYVSGFLPTSLDTSIEGNESEQG